MPRQNRVTPFGEIIATSARGSLLGNRGVLHDHAGNLRRAWQVKRWLLCLLNFKGRKRAVMTPGRYTELFFLDEATGLAAGHRPCAECRRERFRDFCTRWPSGHPTAIELDNQLHAERLNPDGSKRLFQANLEDLPDGVFITQEPSGPVCLLWQGQLLTWSPGGYRERVPRPRAERVGVLTPRSTVAALRAGYVPAIHRTGQA